jgi:hypothetical protein
VFVDVWGCSKCFFFQISTNYLEKNPQAIEIKEIEQLKCREHRVSTIESPPSSNQEAWDRFDLI